MEESASEAALNIQEHIRTLSFVPLETGVVRLGAAIVLGGLIGLERELRDRPAGLRTHMMIAMAAALFTIIGFELIETTEQRDGLRFDPLRLIEAVTSGVAFLAAGAILVRGGSVKGLTTGASMWLCGAVGVACGTGHLWLAMIAALLTLLVLFFIRIFEGLLPTKDRNGRDEEGGD